MKAFIFGLCLSATLFFTGNLSAITDSSTGFSFPDKVTVKDGDESYKLEATGVATRKKFIIKVYSIAHYMEDPKSKKSAKSAINEVLKSNKAKQFTMTWARAVDNKKIRGAYEDAFKQVFSKSEEQNMKPEIKKFLGFFRSDSKKNDKYILQWLPDGKLIVKINGKKAGEIDNNDFAKAVWEIWFNPKSVVDRDDLVSKIS
jgi:Chalcone isomerase-like